MTQPYISLTVRVAVDYEKRANDLASLSGIRPSYFYGLALVIGLRELAAVIDRGDVEQLSVNNALA
jgi:flagellar basal body P-ring protein FlgI